MSDIDIKGLSSAIAFGNDISKVVALERFIPYTYGVKRRPTCHALATFCTMEVTLAISIGL